MFAITKVVTCHAKFVVSITRSPAASRVTCMRIQQVSNEIRSGFRRATRHKTATQSVKDAVYSPAGTGAFSVGRGALAGASALGLGALCYYGLGLSSQPGALERAALWPTHVRARIRDTYLYFGGSIVCTAGSALAIARSPTLMNMMMKNSWIAIGASLVAMIGSGMVCRSIPYEEGVGVKQLAWLVHTGVVGAVIAPITLLGGPLLIRAAWYTAGAVGALSTVAACAPSERFLSMGGPLALCLGGVLVASLGGMFFPPTTALGAGLYSISIYGGLIVFGGFLLYDTQKIVKMAENWPVYGMDKYDPINASVGIYLDTVNIFIRIATILAGGGGRRK